MSNEIDSAFPTGKSFTVVLILLLGAYLAVFSFLALSAQATADDFSYATRAVKCGFIESQVSWYVGWSGRYASTAVMSVFALALDMIRFYWTIPLSLIAATCLTFSVTTHVIAKGRLTVPQSSLCGLIFTSSYLSGVPSITETIYWLAGGVTYQGGNVLFLALVAAMVKMISAESPRQRATFFALCCLLAVSAVGMNETIMLILAAAMAVLAVWAFRISLPARYLVLSLLVVTLAASAAVMAAPGNAVRSHFFPQGHQMLHSILGSAGGAVLDVAVWARSLPLWMATFLCVPVAAGALARHPSITIRNKPALLALPIVWLAALSLVYFPAFWSMGSRPPTRTLSIAYLIFLLGWFPTMTLLWSVAIPGARAFSPRYHAFVATASIATLFTTGNGAVAVEDLGKDGPYSQKMTERYQAIRAAKAGNVLEVKVPVLLDYPRTLFMTDLSVDKKDWRTAVMPTISA